MRKKKKKITKPTVAIEAAKEASTVSRTLVVEIAKPLSINWDSLSVLLNTQARLVPQLLRAGMDARISAGFVGTEATRGFLLTEAKQESRKAFTAQTAQGMPYQAMLRELARAKKGKWSEAARPCLELATENISAMSQIVNQKHKDRSSFKGAQPIYIKGSGCSIGYTNNGPTATVKLLSDGTVTLALRAKGRDHGLLKRMAEGDLVTQTMSIVRKNRKRKWFLHICYKAPCRTVPEESLGNVLVVHRGIRNALALMSSTGCWKTVSGEKMHATLDGFQARLRKLGIGPHELGDGAKGHGETRRYAHKRKLSGRRKRFVRTWCQQQGALVVKLAKQHGCGTVAIEDYGGMEPNDNDFIRRNLVRFPMYQLKQAIFDACEKEGLRVMEYPAEYVSTTCPACANDDTRQHNKFTGTFHCANCSLERPADFVTALNALRRLNASGLWEERMEKAARLASRLRRAGEDQLITEVA